MPSKDEEDCDESKEKYCIHGNHVWISEKQEFMDAWIFVNGELIYDVLFPTNSIELIQ